MQTRKRGHAEAPSTARPQKSSPEAAPAAQAPASTPEAMALALFTVRFGAVVAAEKALRLAAARAAPPRGPGRPGKRAWNGWDDPRRLLTAAQRKAVIEEARFARDVNEELRERLPPEELTAQHFRPALRLASLGRIAARVGASKVAVHKWRADRAYRAAILCQMRDEDEASAVPPLAEARAPAPLCGHPQRPRDAMHHPLCRLPWWPDRPCREAGCPGAMPPPRFTFRR